MTIKERLSALIDQHGGKEQIRKVALSHLGGGFGIHVNGKVVAWPEVALALLRKIENLEDMIEDMGVEDDEVEGTEDKAEEIEGLNRQCNIMAGACNDAADLRKALDAEHVLTAKLKEELRMQIDLNRALIAEPGEGKK